MSSLRMVWSFCALFVTAVGVNSALAQTQDVDSLCQVHSQQYQTTYLRASTRKGSLNFCARPEVQIAEPATGCASLVQISKIHYEEALLSDSIRICIIKLIDDANLVRDAEVLEGYACATPWDAQFVKLSDGTFACAKKRPDLISMLR